jgi:hypothetical protein
MSDEEDVPPPFTTPAGLERTDYFDQEHPGAGEFHQHKENRFAAGMDPQDGLPRPLSSVSQEDSYVPGLSPKTFVCMEDRSQFVVRSADGTIVGYLQPDQVQEVARGTFAPLDKTFGDGGAILSALARGGRIEPIRLGCQHYARQMIDMPDNPRHRMMIRLCTAQRTETGEYVSLRDAQMFGCELRSPRDAESEAVLDEFDAKLLTLAANRDQKPFDVHQALEKERSAGLEEPPKPTGAGGIFG